MTILRATRGFVLNNARRAYSSTVDASRKAYFEELKHSREHAASKLAQLAHLNKK
jgi:hypothetical protein